MRFYKFADFRIDCEERVLYQNHAPIRLAPKVFDTLFALVSRSKKGEINTQSVDDRQDGGNLWQTNLASGERQPITNFTAERIFRFDLSPDRRFSVLARGDYFYDAVLIER